MADARRLAPPQRRDPVARSASASVSSRFSAKQSLGLDDVGSVCSAAPKEYLLRKFAEGGGASAGEFYTPCAVAVLMAHILDPQPGMTVYDPCCGYAGLIIKQPSPCRWTWIIQISSMPFI